MPCAHVKHFRLVKIVQHFRVAFVLMVVEFKPVFWENIYQVLNNKSFLN